MAPKATEPDGETDAPTPQPGRERAREVVTRAPRPRHEHPELEAFGEQMAEAERITCIICTVVGGVLGVLTIVLLLTGWLGLALLALFPAAICLARALGKFGADLEAVRGFRILGFLRWTPYPWWLYRKRKRRG